VPAFSPLTEICLCDENAYPLQAIFAEIVSFHPILVTNLLALLVLVIWLYLAFLRGNFWRLEEDNSNPSPWEMAAYRCHRSGSQRSRNHRPRRH